MRSSGLTLCLGLSVAWILAGPQYLSADSIQQHFGDPKAGGYEGCFLVAELDGEGVLRSGEGCGERYAPCSTFKIPNSLIGLESGTIERDTVIPWDGSRQNYRVWERDHDLASAIRNSVVWYYQELARRVGEQKMQSYVDRFDYGNRDLSGGLTRFWLGSTLEISADEQIRFLSKLYTGKLPVSDGSAAAVKEMLLYKESAVGQESSWRLSAKTGSCWLDDGESLGWWVGHLRQGQVERLFAARIRGKGADGQEARKLTLGLLADPEIATSIGLAPISTK